LYKKYISEDGVESGGTKPSGTGDTLEDLRPLTDNVLAVMAEEGIDVSEHKRKPVTKEMVAEAGMIVSMAEPETTPDFVKKHPNFVEWQVDDPKGTDLDTHRKAKDQIKEKIMETFG
jgi:protein-tyrosine-phosphatase